MDSDRCFRYGVTGADLSQSSNPTVPPTPVRLFGSLKLDSRNSPNSPFLSHFDSETLTTLSDSQDQYSSSENLSGASASCNSSLDYNHQFQALGPLLDCQLGPSLEFHQKNLLLCSGDSTSLQHARHDHNIENTLPELEKNTLMGHDDEEEGIMPDPSLGENKEPQSSGPRSTAWNLEHQGSHVMQFDYVLRHGKSGDNVLTEKRRRQMEVAHLQVFPSGDLKKLLIDCARALYDDTPDNFEILIEKAQGAVSISGDPIQRLGAYMVEGLVARKEATGTAIYQALRCAKPEGKDLLSYMHILYEICPYLKFGYMAANGAIAEVCRCEDRIHIIDFQIAQGTQWITLLQALAARPNGPPHVRITGIDDPVSKYARGDSLEAVGKRLAVISEKFNIPVEFHAVSVFAPYVTRDMLDIRPGEALAVNFPLQLHHTPDESVDVNNPRDGLLRMVKSLSPMVTTLVEQESNTNTAPFLPRFIETLEYYLAIFESMDVTMPRDRKERINVEQHCLARDIVNIIACEGKDRVERHELLGKWKSRLMMAGFRQYPLSSYVNSVIRTLLGYYSDQYTLVEKDGAMLLGWKDRNLISASAWH
ncbi:unnamed protein product [Ilex paraguariensis]|uniref:Chitin-inducible gibberellin-responsive protein 1 n=1 Tax=Ilex paraguariensis TaxID=185542 RepID=A0ABC8RZB1_9AQUA